MNIDRFTSIVCLNKCAILTCLLAGLAFVFFFLIKRVHLPSAILLFIHFRSRASIECTHAAITCSVRCLYVYSTYGHVSFYRLFFYVSITMQCIVYMCLEAVWHAIDVQFQINIYSYVDFSSIHKIQFLILINNSIIEISWSTKENFTKTEKKKAIIMKFVRWTNENHFDRCVSVNKMCSCQCPSWQWKYYIFSQFSILNWNQFKCSFS